MRGPMTSVASAYRATELPTRRHADTPTRRHADLPTCRPADLPTYRLAGVPTYPATLPSDKFPHGYRTPGELSRRAELRRRTVRGQRSAIAGGSRSLHRRS